MRLRCVVAALLGFGSSLLSTSALAGCEVVRIAELPVTMSGLRPMVQAKINGADASFIADSGAFYSSISPGNAAQYGLRLTSLPGARVRGVGGDVFVSLATVKTFTLVGVAIPNVQFIVGGSEIGGVGLLGQNVLGLADVEYDLGHSAIRLMRPRGGCGNADLAYWAAGRPVSRIAIEPRSPANPHTIGTILINGVKIRATFDTGAPMSILSLSAAARAGVKPDSPGVNPAEMASGLGRHVARSWIAPFASFKVDGEEIRNTRLLIGQLDLDGIDMLVGADFFLAHRIYVANGQHRMYLTYEGGPVFNLTPHAVMTADGTPSPVAADTTPAPKDAEAFSQRGEVFLSRHDFTAALADLSRAVAMKPDEARYAYQRAQAYREQGQAAPARADLDQALKLRPDYGDALLARAEMRAEAHDGAGAMVDLDAARHAAAPSADSRLDIGRGYEMLRAYEPAIGEYDLWIKAHPDDSRRPEALNARCWARTLTGRDLDKALADCNGAVHAMPRRPDFLDSRGLVHLRRDELDKAIADYDAALALRPNIGWSLYGRGVAERRKGMEAAAATDIAAARAINAELPERFKALGIDPKAGG